MAPVRRPKTARGRRSAARAEPAATEEPAGGLQPRKVAARPPSPTPSGVAGQRRRSRPHALPSRTATTSPGRLRRPRDVVRAPTFLAPERARPGAGGRPMPNRPTRASGAGASTGGARAAAPAVPDLLRDVLGRLRGLGAGLCAGLRGSDARGFFSAESSASGRRSSADEVAATTTRAKLLIRASRRSVRAGAKGQSRRPSVVGMALAPRAGSGPDAAFYWLCGASTRRPTQAVPASVSPGRGLVAAVARRAFHPEELPEMALDPGCARSSPH